MTDSPSGRYLLVFSGDIMPDTNLVKAQQALADFFGLDDPYAVSGFFSGQPVPLRRNLTQRDALDLYRDLRSLGLLCEVIAPESETSTKGETNGEKKPEENVGEEADNKLSDQNIPDAGTTLSTAVDKTTTGDADIAPNIKSAQAQTRRAPAASKKPAGLTKAPQNGGLQTERLKLKRAPGPGPQILRPTGTGAAATDVAKQSRPPAKHRPAGGRNEHKTTGSLASAKSPSPTPMDRPALTSQTATAEAPPNLFSLQPAFSANKAERSRALASSRTRLSLLTTLVLTLLTALLLMRYPMDNSGLQPPETLAVAVRGDNTLILLTANSLLLHARSGLPERVITANELGLRTLAPPIWSASESTLLLNAEVDDVSTLMRCELNTGQCAPFFSGDEEITVVAIDGSPISNGVYLLTDQGELLRSSLAGELEARASLEGSGSMPRLQNRDGLLYSAAGDAPALTVHRPDVNGFAQQLDTVLLTPQSTDDDQTRVRDFIFGTAANWALLYDDQDRGRLYRFDAQWGNPSVVATIPRTNRVSLVTWRDKLLIVDPGVEELARFAANGDAETAFSSPLLQNEREQWQIQQEQFEWRRRAIIAAVAILAALAMLMTLRSWMVQRAAVRLIDSATDLLDPLPAHIEWLPGGKNKVAQLRTLNTALLGLPTLALLLAVLLGDSRVALLSFVPAWLGGLYAAANLQRGCAGRLGIAGSKLIAVDHSDRYFYARPEAFLSGPGFVFSPSLALGLALPGLLNIDTGQSRKGVRLITQLKQLTALETLGMLWHLRHPWGRAIASLTVGWLMCIAGYLLSA